MIDLQKERVNRGLSQRDLADELGCSEESVRRIENGAVPRPKIGKKFADFYGVKFTDLWPLEERSAA